MHSHEARCFNHSGGLRYIETLLQITKKALLYNRSIEWLLLLCSGLRSRNYCAHATSASILSWLVHKVEKQAPAPRANQIAGFAEYSPLAQ